MKVIRLCRTHLAPAQIEPASTPGPIRSRNQRQAFRLRPYRRISRIEGQMGPGHEPFDVPRG
ncbi:MAG: hypothetical protein JO307_27855 [Bryobacterales bacterium]|nr:hypothetical protein [Bryobacterales bacterium]